MSELEALAYADGDVALTGWLARPAGATRAAIVLFPTIANINPAMERRAAMLADLGFLVMVADFYGEPVADFAAAGRLAERLRTDVDTYRARLGAAIAALKHVVDSVPLFAVGYCMGGQAALEVAREGHDLAGVVTFHGLLSTERKAALGAIRPRILVCHGDADPLVPREQVLSFWDEMDAAGADWHFHAYSGVRHGFTDPGSDARGLDAIAYNASADRQSWAAFQSFVDEILDRR